MEQNVGLSEEIMDDSSRDIGESEITPRIPEGQRFVIETQCVKESGVEIVHVHFVDDCVMSPLVSFAIRGARLESSAREP
jgi:hypothetical protein